MRGIQPKTSTMEPMIYEHTDILEKINNLSFGFLTQEEVVVNKTLLRLISNRPVDIKIMHYFTRRSLSFKEPCPR